MSKVSWKSIETAPHGERVRVRSGYKNAVATLYPDGRWMARGLLLVGAISPIWFAPSEWAAIDEAMR